MKLARTKQYHFGWLAVISAIDIVFLLIFFLLLSSNFILQPGIAVSLPLSRFTLGPQVNPQIISITGGAAPSVYFRDQKVALDQLGPLLDAAKSEGRPVIIKADRQTPYELVVAVTNATLERGITSVSLASAPPP
ncbi:MAG: biopolymer transporter ExbD [Chthoniobacterales bacterium]|nr:biopolymer transporter ExbD [Chthoniobacterales bacterium]MDQ3119530.1 biopolymer transporter ExbD [Verrucomicrobiota bacterium]